MTIKQKEEVLSCLNDLYLSILKEENKTEVLLQVLRIIRKFENLK